MSDKPPLGGDAYANYLQIRLSGMEEDIELTPGYIKWREHENEKARLTNEVRMERRRVAGRLSTIAIEEKTSV